VTSSKGVFTFARYADRLKNSVGLRELVGATIDECFRRFVAHEMASELCRDETRSCGSARDEIEHLLAFFLSTSRRKLATKNGLRVGIMDHGEECELTGLTVERPPGQCARDFLHVLLSIPSIDAECV
jgi:hypothetical protein